MVKYLWLAVCLKQNLLENYDIPLPLSELPLYLFPYTEIADFGYNSPLSRGADATVQYGGNPHE